MNVEHILVSAQALRETSVVDVWIICHFQCKHVLAVKLAQKLGRCVKRTVDEENIMNMIDQST